MLSPKGRFGLFIFVLFSWFFQMERYYQNQYQNVKVISVHILDNYTGNFHRCQGMVGLNKDGNIQHESYAYQKKIIGVVGLNCQSSYCLAKSKHAPCDEGFYQDPNVLPCYEILLEDGELVSFDECFPDANKDELAIDYPSNIISFIIRLWFYILIGYSLVFLIYLH